MATNFFWTSKHTLKCDWIYKHRSKLYKNRNPIYCLTLKLRTHTLALSSCTKHIAKDGQVCFHGGLFANTVKPQRCTTEPVRSLDGINKDVSDSKLLLTTTSSYPVHCACFSPLLKTQHHCLCPNGSCNPPSASHPSPPPSHPHSPPPPPHPSHSPHHLPTPYHLPLPPPRLLPLTHAPPIHPHHLPAPPTHPCHLPPPFHPPTHSLTHTTRDITVVVKSLLKIQLC